MSDLQIRQGTVYQEKTSGSRLLLIHHDPMSLCSMAIPGNSEAFDCAHPIFMSIDELITIRKSEAFDELGDVPKEFLNVIIDAVIGKAEPALEENVIKLLQAIQKENGKES